MTFQQWAALIGSSSYLLLLQFASSVLCQCGTLQNVSSLGIRICESVWPEGSAIAQAVNPSLPTAVARFRARVRSCENCGVQSGTGVGFLQALRFTLPLIPPTVPHSSFIIRDWYNRPNSGRRTKWTRSDPVPRKNIVDENFDVNFVM
jgi:hypothetical protein